MNLKKKQTIGTADAELALQEAERRKLELIEAMTQAVVAAIDDKKGLDLEVMKVTEKTTL
ncbi:MAG: RsfS/YbeB/iojap family protein, partial [Clostridiaceae bacterium]|nr:RsfS/YbeB/iojap family protein [Clostridiaceae bacterium]